MYITALGWVGIGYNAIFPLWYISIRSYIYICKYKTTGLIFDLLKY